MSSAWHLSHEWTLLHSFQPAASCLMIVILTTPLCNSTPPLIPTTCCFLTRQLLFYFRDWYVPPSLVSPLVQFSLDDPLKSGTMFFPFRILRSALGPPLLRKRPLPIPREFPFSHRCVWHLFSPPSSVGSIRVCAIRSGSLSDAGLSLFFRRITVMTQFSFILFFFSLSVKPRWKIWC